MFIFSFPPLLLSLFPVAKALRNCNLFGEQIANDSPGMKEKRLSNNYLTRLPSTDIGAYVMKKSLETKIVLPRTIFFVYEIRFENEKYATWKSKFDSSCVHKLFAREHQPQKNTRFCFWRKQLQYTTFLNWYESGAKEALKSEINTYFCILKKAL